MAPRLDALRRDYAVESAPGGREGPRRSRLRPRWRTVFVAVVAFALVAGAVAVLNSPLLEIRGISVSGTRELSPETVAQIAALRGDNLLLADLAAARERLLELTLVREASVERSWPDGIRIVVQERTPWAGWEVEGEVFAVDAEGVVLEGLAAPAEGPVVRQVSSLPVVQNGATIDLDALATIHWIEEAGPPPGGPAILVYEWSLRSRLTVVTAHGRVTFGGSNGLPFKYQVWTELEAEAQRRGEPLLLADLRFGARPAVEIGLGVGRAAHNSET